ncbi:hypothetical protein AAG570_000657 [Ranatra chinensis]|uniref:GATA zinc finger domain-containing protein 1 n=1 Tax=Ranatra chinensis TaxID=642074 RepID=A0ABD0Z829_9HEMI
MASRFVCSKCGSREIVDDDQDSYCSENEGEALCEHCNEDLIAKNLAKEIMNHELLIKRDDEDDEESSQGEGDPDGEVGEEEMEDQEEEEEDEEGDDGSNGEEEVTDEEEGERDDDDDEDNEEVDEEQDGEEEEEGEDGQMVRRSSRSTLNKYKNPDLEPPETEQMRGRRARFLRRPPVYRSPNSQVTSITSPYVFHRGVYYQLGDIVAINDARGRGVYYAQITGLITDQYCNKKATIQWLLPTDESPDHNVAFDPRSYYLGYVEDILRPLDYLVPVMHAPSDYYKFNADPYPPVIPPPHIAKYVWHNLERVYIKRTG